MEGIFEKITNGVVRINTEIHYAVLAIFFKGKKKQNFIFLYSGSILDVPIENNDWNFNRTTGDENEISLEISRFGTNPYLPPVIISPKDFGLIIKVMEVPSVPKRTSPKISWALLTLSQLQKKYSTFSTMSRSLKYRLVDMMSRSELNCKQNRNVVESCTGGMDELYVILDGSDSILIDSRRTWNHFIDVSKDLVVRMKDLNTTVSFIVPQQLRKKQRMHRYGDKFGYKVLKKFSIS